MAGTGILRVRVYASSAELPLPGATVVVTQTAPTGKQILLSVQSTDQSGLTQPIEISTPAAAESESPDWEGGEPVFAQCDVWAEHPGFVMLTVKGVQIFSGVETIQNMELIPLAEGQESLRQHRRQETSSQNL